MTNEAINAGTAFKESIQILSKLIFFILVSMNLNFYDVGVME